MGGGLGGGEELYRVNEEKRKQKIEEQIGKNYGYYTILSFAEYRNHEMFFHCVNKNSIDAPT